MAEVVCKICNTRRPRRYCPGVEGDICSVCCGTEREVTVSCPYGCDYLAESRRHEKPSQHAMPHPEVEITDGFMQRNEILLMFSINVWGQVLGARGQQVIDRDVREALAALNASLKRESSSGLIYQEKPENAIAAALQEEFSAKFTAWRTATEQRGAEAGVGGQMIRDADVLRVWIFLERTCAAMDNGRPKCRAFIDMMRAWVDRVAANADQAAPAAE